jgi:hypothetical protein
LVLYCELSSEPGSLQLGQLIVGMTTSELTLSQTLDCRRKG